MTDQAGSFERPASLTALSVTLQRAAHLVLDEPPPVLDDPLAIRLLGPDARSRILAEAGRLRSPRALAFRSHVLVRSRFAEDVLEESAVAGVRQFVSLGAGMDTFACRQPGWARDLHLFEVDHPASQSAKRKRLAAARIEEPANLSFVPVDLELDPLAGRLAEAGFDLAAPAVVSCLGVVMYLQPETAGRIFEFAGKLAQGSRFVLTFTRPAMPGEDGLGERAARVGEPWHTRMEPEELRGKLLGLGFREVSFPGSTGAIERYFRDRRDGLTAPRSMNIAVASV